MLDRGDRNVTADPAEIRSASRAVGKRIVLVIGVMLILFGGYMIYSNSRPENAPKAANTTDVGNGPVPQGAPVPGPTKTAPVPNR